MYIKVFGDAVIGVCALQSVDMRSIPLLGHLEDLKTGIHRLFAWYSSQKKIVKKKICKVACRAIEKSTNGISPLHMANR